jgi:uncharacterized protein
MHSYANKTALITGASAGIGLCFAQQLAARGANLVLVARRAERLEKTAEDLRARFGIRVHCYAADLAHGDSCEAIFARLQADNLHVDVLINNAGFGLPGTYVSQPWTAHQESLQVLLMAPSELTRLCLPGMLARGYGRVVNVASLAAFAPASPAHTTYGAIKSYLVRWSESLSLEVRQRGVHVLALCPGFTYTEFHDVNGARALVNRLPKWLWMDVDSVVSEAIIAMENGKSVHINGRVNRLLAGLFKYLPGPIANLLVKSQSKNFREQNPNDLSTKH